MGKVLEFKRKESPDTLRVDSTQPNLSNLGKIMLPPGGAIDLPDEPEPELNQEEAAQALARVLDNLFSDDDRDAIKRDLMGD